MNQQRLAGIAVVVSATLIAVGTTLSANATPGDERQTNQTVNATGHAATVQSNNTSSRDVSSLIHPACEKHHVPGMVAAIVEDDHVVALAVDGVRERGKADRVTVDDQFHIGSCTKAM